MEPRDPQGSYSLDFVVGGICGYLAFRNNGWLLRAPLVSTGYDNFGAWRIIIVRLAIDCPCTVAWSHKGSLLGKGLNYLE